MQLGKAPHRLVISGDHPMPLVLNLTIERGTIKCSDTNVDGL